MRRFTLAIASVLLITGGAAFADILPQNAQRNLPPSAVPQIEPIVLGTVTGTSAHTVDVSTTTGEHVTFEFDSRTVMPSNLDGDTRVKVNFKLLDSGLHLAQRITRLERGSHEWDMMDRQIQSSDNDSDDDNDPSDDRQYRGVSDGDDAARNATDDDHAANRTADVHEHRGVVATAVDDDGADDVNRGGDDANAANTLDSDHDGTNDRDEMPNTASELPLVLSLGVLALAASAGLWLWRRRSA